MRVFPDFNESVDITTNEATYSVEFTATESMFRLYQSDGTTKSTEELGLAIRFFNGYKNDDGTYKDVTITLDDLLVEEVPSTVGISLVGKTPDTVIGENDFTAKPSVARPGFNAKTGEPYQWNEEDGTLLLIPANAKSTTMANSGQNIQLKNLLTPLWKEQYVGKTVRITFRAKSDADGALDLGLGSEVGTYNWPKFPGISSSASLTKDWKPFTFEFTVTNDMLATDNPLNLRFGLMAWTAKNEAGTNVYQNVTISIDDVKAVVLNGSTPVAYTASYDFKTSKPAQQCGFSWEGATVNNGKPDERAGTNDPARYRFENETFVMNPAYKRGSGNPSIAAADSITPDSGNSGQNIQLLNLLDGIFNDPSNKGKTFRIKLTMKAAEAGQLHVSLAANKTCYLSGDSSKNNLFFSSFGGTVNRFDLTTEYQTYVMEFTANAEMFPDNLVVYNSQGESSVSGAKPQIAFRFRDGFRDNEGYYKNVDISVKSVKIEGIPEYAETSLPTEAAAAVSGGSVSDTLTVYPNPDPIEPADIKRAYLTFTVPETAELYEAWLTLTATAAAGQTVTVYAMTDLELPNPLTYGNAPLPSGSALTTFRAKLGENRIDLTEWIRANAGHKVTFLLTIEEAGSDVVFDNTTSLPTLTLGTATADNFDPSSFRVKSNVTLYSDFGYNVYVPAIEAVKEITLDGISHALYELEQKTIGDTVYYVVPFRIAAKEGTDAHTVGVKLNKGGTLLSKSYTVSLPSYAKKLLNDQSASEEAKTVVRDMLSYIDAAMTYFGTSTEAKRAKITELIGANYDGALAVSRLPNAVESTAGLSSACLDLGAIPSFVFYPKDKSLAQSFEFTANGAYLEKSVKTDETGRVYLEVRTYAYGMLRTLSYTYTDAEGVTQSGSYNLTAYYAGVQSEGTKTLVLHLAKYADSAIAYRNSVIH